MIGPGVASECVETKDGPTIWEDHFYPEIVDPATGAVLPDGEHGELVLTSLTKEAMPVIRYRTRDLTRLLPGTARTMRRMEKVTGRSDDMIILRGVNVFPSQIEEQILKCRGLAPHLRARARPRRPARHDERAGRGAPRRGRPGDARSAGQELIHHVKAVVGVRCASTSSIPARSIARSARPSACSTCGRRTRRGPLQTQPASSRRATVSMTRMPSAPSLRQGSAAKRSPPPALKSLPGAVQLRSCLLPPGVEPLDPGSLLASVRHLGLKLEAKKEPVKTIVVDQIERTPTGN